MALQPEGNNKLKLINELQKQTLTKTSAQGQELLRRELDTLTSDWETFVADVSEAREKLKQSLQAWHDFEDSHNALSQWLRAKEQQVKEYELQSTLEEKTEQVEKLKVRTSFCSF